MIPAFRDAIWNDYVLNRATKVVTDSTGHGIHAYPFPEPCVKIIRSHLYSEAGIKEPDSVDDQPKKKPVKADLPTFTWGQVVHTPPELNEELDAILRNTTTAIQYNNRN